MKTVDPTRIVVSFKPKVDDEVFIAACKLMWPREEAPSVSTKEVVDFLRRKFGPRANFIADLLLPGE